MTGRAPAGEQCLYYMLSLPTSGETPRTMDDSGSGVMGTAKDLSRAKQNTARDISASNLVVTELFPGDADE